MKKAMFIDAIGMLDQDIIDAYILKDTKLRSPKTAKKRRTFVTLLAATISVLLVFTLLITSLPLAYATNTEQINQTLIEAFDSVLFPLDSEDSENINRDALLLNWTEWEITEQFFAALGAGTESSKIDQMLQDAELSDSLIGNVKGGLAELLKYLYEYYMRHHKEQEENLEEGEIDSSLEQTLDQDNNSEVNQGLVYKKDPYKDAYYVAGIGDCTDTIIEIPETYEGLPVIGIDAKAFKGCNNIEQVVLHDGIFNINESAFESCTSLKTILLPDSLMTIGPCAFMNCTALKEIVIPESCVNLGESIFYNSGLQYADVRISSNKLPVRTFADCVALKTVKLSGSITDIRGEAFTGCTGLVSIDLPEGLQRIGKGAFSHCTSLVSVTLPDSLILQGLEESAFLNCRSLVSINIPGSVSHIKPYTFNSCSSLQTVTIGNGITTIQQSAFAGCGSLKAVELPDSVISLGNSAFLNCTALEEISLSADLVIIEDWCFDNCSSLYSLNIGKGNTELGKNSFNNCDSLKYIYLQNLMDHWISHYDHVLLSSGVIIICTDGEIVIE